MFQCHVCNSTKAHAKLVSDVFIIDGKPILVEGIPAQVCDYCGEAVFSRETTEEVRRMVHGESHPDRSIQMEVFAFA